MMNEAKSREEQIMDIARHIRDAGITRDRGAIDSTGFTSSQVADVSMHRLAAAIYLYDLGYRLTNPDDITIVVKNGLVSQVYSTNEDIAVNVIDLDDPDPYNLEELERELQDVQARQKSIW